MILKAKRIRSGEKYDFDDGRGPVLVLAIQETIDTLWVQTQDGEVLLVKDKFGNFVPEARSKSISIKREDISILERRLENISREIKECQKTLKAWRREA